MMPRSFDTVGAIAIVEIPASMQKKAQTIAKKIIQQNKHIKTVLGKIGGHKGKYRVQKVKFIYGEKTTLTTHKESGLSMQVDVATCYFSPRLSAERLRIAKQVKPRERILVMFAGVGPYALVLAKHTKASEVVAVEANPHATRLANENVALNKLKNIIFEKGDVRKIVPKLGRFDRILMPLPSNSLSYLETALKATKKKSMLHVYTFAPEGEFEIAGRAVAERCRALGYSCTVKSIVKCGQQKPRAWRICIDALAKH